MGLEDNMKLLLKKGLTSYIVEVFIPSTLVTTGAGLTGLAYNSAGQTCYYHRNSAAAAVAMTLVDMTVGTWTSLGFKEVDATNMPGVYQIGLPNAMLASGADSVSLVLKGATNAAPLVLEIQLTGFDLATAAGDQIVEGTWTQNMLLRLYNSVLLGIASGMGTATGTFRDIDNTKNRIVVTQDASGNRSAFGTKDGT